jgi:ABC-type nitrate/sulfonate/bicarbonate transport system permease component
MTTSSAIEPVLAPVPVPERRGVRWDRVGLAIALPLVLIAVWQVCCWIFQPRAWILPSPAAVARAGWEVRDRLWYHAQWTIVVTVIGFALAVVVGSLLAALIARSRIAGLMLYPWIIVSQTIPLVALAPLLVLWMPEFGAMITLAALISIFPVIVAGVDGLRGTDPEVTRAMRALGASLRWVGLHVQVPGALPRWFTGLRLAAVFSVTGAVVGELVASTRGLGVLTRLSAGQFETPVTFAAVIILALIGIAMFLLVAVAEWAALPYLRRATRPGTR